ncbi:MAG: hypothetical protein UR26_C0006G0039 [candidate division TM6 bacterium GW2011_GWF2_32_72]|nr:MAG: hypothetical protein UR26_C0006G0039 [candidate division TM6 bacterium GW2011_GWF2_32_72]
MDKFKFILFLFLLVQQAFFCVVCCFELNKVESYGLRFSEFVGKVLSVDETRNCSSYWDIGFIDFLNFDAFKFCLNLCKNVISLFREGLDALMSFPKKDKKEKTSVAGRLCLVS